MLDTINKFLCLPHVERYRKGLYTLSASLLLLHLLAFALPLVLPDEPRMRHLVNISFNLYGVTGALLLIVVLGEAIRAMSDADIRGRSDTYRFISQALSKWFEGTELGASLGEITSQTYTDYKVRGSEALLAQKGSSRGEHRFTGSFAEASVDPEILSRFCSEIHFEFTFYPTMIIYGIHFESPSRDANESMLAAVRTALALGDASGFTVDHQVPQKAPWVFFIRTVEVSGDFERDMPKVTTHARHFVELIGHGYDVLYSIEMLERFKALEARNKSAVG